MDRQKFGSQTKSNIFNKSAVTEDSSRKEVGAIWSKTTKTNRVFLSIKLSKDKLKQLLESGKDSINLIAFTNDTTNDKQPNFRIFEEIK